MTAAAEGLPMSKLYLFATMVLPLILVGSDMVSDGGVMAQMWPYTFFGSQEARKRPDALILGYLFVVSIIVLSFSSIKLLLSNPLATLVRNARTTVMMNSRELERKDVPVPLGNS